MVLKFLYPHWGSESMEAKAFVSHCLEEGFDGIEINLPTEPETAKAFRQAIREVRTENPEFKFIAQQVLPGRTETPKSYLNRMLARLNWIMTFEPDMINSHTGKDHFTFEENAAILAEVEKFERFYQVPVFHEIHRGRFTFHSATTLPYLEYFPDLKLTGDLSHWCLVSESLLEDQTEVLSRVIPHIRHLHARVGFEQASQVNDPFAPEWQTHVNRFMQLWQEIIDYHRHDGREVFTITPEFGPYPYMPQSPYDQQPQGDQQAINRKFKELLIHQLTTVI